MLLLYHAAYLKLQSQIHIEQHEADTDENGKAAPTLVGHGEEAEQCGPHCLHITHTHSTTWDKQNIKTRALDPEPNVFLNADPDPAAFSMRIPLSKITLYKFKEFSVVEKDKKDCSKQKKTKKTWRFYRAVQIYFFFYFNNFLAFFCF